MNLEKYICDLLYRHECVIVPEFGGFIKNYEPAHIQHTTHTISPPRKYLVFNSGLTINDGLLATEISSSKGIGFDEAMQFIQREIVAWNERLKAGKRITLSGIGTFHINRGNKIEFKPEPEQNFFDEAFGLSPLVVPPIQSRRKQAGDVRQYQTRRIRTRRLRRVAWAAAITIPLIVAGLWSVMNYDTLRQYATQHSGVFRDMGSAFKPSEKTLPGPETAIIDEHAPAETPEHTGSEAPDQELMADAEATAESLAPGPHTPEPQPEALPLRNYHIIIGSFSNETNARHLAGELSDKGWNATVVESSRGMYRVSMAAYANKSEALKELYKVREEQNSAAWLLRI